MASAKVVEMSVMNNSPSQDSNHPDDLFQLRYEMRYIKNKKKRFFLFFFGLELVQDVIIVEIRIWRLRYLPRDTDV